MSCILLHPPPGCCAAFTAALLSPGFCLRCPFDHLTSVTATLLIPWLLSQNEELELQYKTSYARILDSKRRFLEASQRYYELSQIGNREINGLRVSPRLFPEPKDLHPEF